MKVISLSLFCLCFLSVSFAQKTVKIRKENTQLYKGIESQINNWYIYKKENAFYLCPLNIPKEEVVNWFEKRVNSQNIYKGLLSEQQYAILSFRKDNDPTDVINFYYKQVKHNLELVSSVDGNKYTFRPIFQE